MAAQQVLFKIACPSCDAQVPIRDSGLIGRKVECPKCKYRFVVEEPADEMGDDEPKIKKAKPKKKSNNNSLIMGLGVGGVAIAVLGVVAYFLFIKESEKPKTTNPNPNPTPIALNNQQPKDDNPAQPASADAPKADAPKADAPPVNTGRGAALPIPPAGTVGELSNLLPNDAQLVVNMNMDLLRFSTLGEQLFESKIGFRPGVFKEKLGFGIEDMLRLIHVENPEQKWTFNAYRMNKPIDFKAMETAMGFKKGKNSPIKGREYYEIPPNEVLDRIADGLKTELEAAGSRMRRANDQSQVMGLAVLDETTMVIANLDQLKEFLQADAKPRHQNKPAKPINDNDPGAPGGAPAAPNRGGRSMSFAFSPDPWAPQPPANPDDPNLVELATYLTIDPPLKAMFDRLEGDLRNRPILTVVMHMQADPKLRQRLVNWTGISLLAQLPMKVFGIVVNKYELEKAYATAAGEFFNENDVKELEAILKKQLPILATALSLYLGGIKIETEGADAVQQPGAGGGGGSPVPGRPGAGGGGGQPGGGGGIGSTLPGFTPLEEGPTSKVKLARRSHYLMVTAELNLVQRAFDRIYAMTEGTVAKMRGMVDMSARTPNWQLLSSAAMKLRENGTVPRATYQLAENTGGRLARNWPPHHRVSWMAGLLPYLNSDEVYRNIDRDKPWRSEKNLKAAAILVPMFLDPRYPDTSWYAKMDSLGNRTLGATHYVGMAGVGADAADYNPATEKDEKRKAEMLKKIGVFGYDRTTAIKDVSDGVTNTIYMISVPPGHQRPWIAGGGATAQGVPESRSIRPFVYNYGGKKGAFVLMLDGTVRFIKEDISDDVFKSLCTIRGGEQVEDINAIAPKVKPGDAAMTTKEKDDEEKDKDKP